MTKTFCHHKIVMTISKFDLTNQISKSEIQILWIADPENWQNAKNRGLPKNPKNGQKKPKKNTVRTHSRSDSAKQANV